MDAPCKIQGSIHVFRLVNNMCPGKWVHIKKFLGASFATYTTKYRTRFCLLLPIGIVQRYGFEY